ncbi:MAG: type II secretion system inner membrane protein GspF [Pseudomonadota bacterium]
MPAYSFEALDANGKTEKGVAEADSARAARGSLRAQGLIPLKVEAVSADGTDKVNVGLVGFLNKKISTRVFDATGLAIWTRQIAGLVSSGLQLERALTALADEAEGETKRNLIAAMRSEVNSGASFAKALGQYRREFSEVYVAVIGAGEQSGNLGLVLERLADDLEAQQELRGKLISAAIYPLIVTIMAIVIVLFLVGYVVPQIAGVFAGSKRALPFLTIAMLAIASFLKTYGWMLLVTIFIAVIGSRVALKNETARQRFDSAWLSLPLVGRLSKGYNAARFTSTLAMLTAAGVPILKALQAAAETLNNRAMRADALDSLMMVREGTPLASALAQKKRFPSLTSMFARLGEQTGQLPLMLERAAHQLGAEVQRRALRLVTILEPLLIVLMGVVVLLIVLAVLMPIIQLNQMAR